MSIVHHHTEWLSLLEISGPFLSLPVLRDAFPQGVEGVSSELRGLLRVAYEEWQETACPAVSGMAGDVRYHGAWVEWVLREGLGLPEEVLHQPSDENGLLERFSVQVLEHGVWLSPDWVVITGTSTGSVEQVARLLVMVVPPEQGLERVMVGNRWKASPATRMMMLLHAKGVRLGLLTNGERWMLVDAPKGETTAFVSWYASLWLEEALTWHSFQTLLGVRRFFGVPEEETLEALLALSANDQQEVTTQLGEQVRRAVELLIQAWEKADQDAGRRLLANVSEERLYEASLTVMMRLVFLLSAEERELLLLGEPLYDTHYAVSTLRAQLRERADQYGEAVLERQFDAWPRLLALFAAVFGGIQHERLILPAYGGSLFDPQRFPFLALLPSVASPSETNTAQQTNSGRGEEPIRVNNRTVLYILEALQLLQVKGVGSGVTEARRLSFRALDIEQIGHVYEGLLDHRAQRAEGFVVIGLRGTKNKQPELPLPLLEAEWAKGQKSFLKYLRGETGRSTSALRKALKIAPDSFEMGRLRAACGNDTPLYERVLPFYGLLRMDSYGTPMVVPAGSLYVTAGEERRATGTHYTPRSLTEPIVQHTLEPLVYEGPNMGKPRHQWRLRPLDKLLELKICDMAMGSGAFLVQSCRYLAERIVEAWEASAPQTRSGGGNPSESAIELLSSATTEEERLALARRLVADRCLYGVDKNPLAVEMAKLSLWLITLNKGQPFTFLDHALKCGDSLVGVDLEQLLYWNLKEEKAREFATEGIRLDIEEIIKLRREISNTPVINPADQQHKVWLLHQAESRTNHLRLGADMLIGSYYNDLNKSKQEALRIALLRAYRSGEDLSPSDAAQVDLGELRPFHWQLEFPEVFLSREGAKELRREEGFDAFVGNPPFLGGTRISTEHGKRYLKLLQKAYPSFHSRADLCSIFFLRAFELLQSLGNFGLIATNTIAQGDTREAGLVQITNNGGEIYTANSSAAWPGSAAVVVSIVHIHKGTWIGKRRLNDALVSHISPMLSRFRYLGEPNRLHQNAGKSFNGSKLDGIGFVLEISEAESLIKQNPKNAEVLFPYLNGKDVNSNPDQSASRWVINFGERTLQEAQQYPDCLAIVRERVYPVRQKHKEKRTRENWWRFQRTRPELYQTIAPLRRVLVAPLVSKYVNLVFMPSNIVFMHKLCVFPFEGGLHLSILQSSIHEKWARQYSSTLGGSTINYSPSDVFETFPFPYPTPQQEQELEQIGERYHEFRRQVMLEREEGLTKTYNRFHDPEEEGEDIAHLRALHVQMDQAVAAAYGWQDVALNHGFHETAQGVRFTISDLARRELLGRLLELNHERHAAEIKAQQQANQKKTSKAKASRKKKSKETGQMSLF